MTPGNLNAAIRYMEDACLHLDIMVSDITVKKTMALFCIGRDDMLPSVADYVSQQMGRRGYTVDVWTDDIDTVYISIKDGGKRYDR